MKLQIFGLLLLGLVIARAEQFEDEQIVKGGEDQGSRSPTLQPMPVSYPGQNSIASEPGIVQSSVVNPSYYPTHGYEFLSGSYDISSGHCSGSVKVDERIHRIGTPYISKRLRLLWPGYGRYRATCIVVTNNVRGYTAATVKVIGGGIGLDYVMLEFQTKNSYGLDFNVEIWAEENRYYY